jgi:hypothetical protein
VRRHFRIVAAPDPQTLPRIMGVFAQRTLVPTTLSARRRRGMLHIDAALDDLDASTAAIIAAKLAASVLVESAICDAADAATSARCTSAAAIAAAA